MRPLTAGGEQTDGALMNSVRLRKRRLCFSGRNAFADGFDGLVSQLRQWVSHPLLRALSACAHAVFGFGSPSQIRERIVVAVSVPVQRFLPWPAWPDERLKDDVMHFLDIWSPVTHQLHMQRAAMLFSRCQWSPVAPSVRSTCSTRPDRAVVSHTVAFEPRHIHVCDHSSFLHEIGGLA